MAWNTKETQKNANNHENPTKPLQTSQHKRNSEKVSGGKQLPEKKASENPSGE